MVLYTRRGNCEVLTDDKQMINYLVLEALPELFQSSLRIEFLFIIWRKKYCKLPPLPVVLITI